MEKISYQQLFVFLQSLGFEEYSTSPLDRIFEHPATETIVAFSMIGEGGDSAQVSRSDYLSVDVRLNQNGLIELPLKDSIREFHEAR